MNNIFINYRREDSNWIALAIYNKLIDYFNQDNIFKDFNTIEPGNDFVLAIDEALNSCSVLLVIIADNWLNITDEKGLQRIFKEDDFVRIEIEKAIAKNKKIIPVLVDNAKMPSSNALPDSIRDLAFKQAFEISTKRFDKDMDELSKLLSKELEIKKEKNLDQIRKSEEKKENNYYDVLVNHNEEEREICFASGNIGSTYGMFAEDIKQIVEEELKIILLKTGGSQESIKFLLDVNSNFDLAILQSDVLHDNKDAHKLLRIIMPLYDEEFHFVTRKNSSINTIYDLQSKRVGLAIKGGAYHTAKIIREKLNIDFEIIGRNSKEAFEDLNSRKIDVIYRNDGVPSKNFGSLPQIASKFYKLISIDDPRLDDLYKKTIIPAHTYFWNTEQIKTYSVKSFLVCKNFPEGSFGYKAVEKITKSIVEHLPQLQMFGHNKWKQVNIFNFTNNPIPYHDAVKKVLKI